MTALHEDAMREAIAADGDAQRALLAGADARRKTSTTSTGSGISRSDG